MRQLTVEPLNADTVEQTTTTPSTYLVGYLWAVLIECLIAHSLGQGDTGYPTRLCACYLLETSLQQKLRHLWLSVNTSERRSRGNKGARNKGTCKCSTTVIGNAEACQSECIQGTPLPVSLRALWQLLRVHRHRHGCRQKLCFRSTHTHTNNK